MDKKIIVLIGASGSGKTTLGSYLKELGIPEIVSHTTRNKREGEIEGVTYYYVSKKEFDMLEKIEETYYAGNYYCISKMEIENKLKNNDFVFVISDINGLKQLEKYYPTNIVSIYVYTSPYKMIERMKKRGDSKESILKRVDNMIKNNELYNFEYADYVIYNDSLENAIKQLNKIIFYDLDYKKYISKCSAV